MDVTDVTPGGGFDTQGGLKEYVIHRLGAGRWDSGGDGGGGAVCIYFCFLFSADASTGGI